MGNLIIKGQDLGVCMGIILEGRDLVVCMDIILINQDLVEYMDTFLEVSAILLCLLIHYQVKNVLALEVILFLNKFSKS